VHGYKQLEYVFVKGASWPRRMHTLMQTLDTRSAAVVLAPCNLTITICLTAGMLCVALTPTLQLAAVCSACLYSLFNFFAGFAMTQPKMPGWW